MDDIEMGVSELVIEVTRRCNASCKHCLRGPQENMDMTKETIDRIFDVVKYSNTVVFTGGEPTLNLPIIEYFFTEARKRGFHYENFYLVTNGLIHQEELALILMREYMFLSMYNNENFSQVAVSADDFHPQAGISILKTLSFYDESKEHAAGDKDWLLSEGNGVQFKNARKRSFYCDEYFCDGDISCLEMLYVNAKGQCVFDCDMSYESQDNHTECSLEDVIQYVTQKSVCEDCA